MTNRFDPVRGNLTICVFIDVLTFSHLVMVIHSELAILVRISAISVPKLRGSGNSPSFAADFLKSKLSWKLCPLDNGAVSRRRQMIGELGLETVERHDPDAQYNLDIEYTGGVGVPQNHAERRIRQWQSLTSLRLGHCIAAAILLLGASLSKLDHRFEGWIEFLHEKA